MSQLLGPIEKAEHRRAGAVEIDIVRVGSGRVGRVVYPPGFRWSKDMKPLVGGDLCRHAHVGFLAGGHIQGTYSDGCAFEFRAPAVVAIEAGHDAWVVGGEGAVL